MQSLLRSQKIPPNNMIFWLFFLSTEMSMQDFGKSAETSALSHVGLGTGERLALSEPLKYKLSQFFSQVLHTLLWQEF